MGIIGLDHVQLAMPPGGEDRARAFYCEALRLPERPKPPQLATRGGCWFETESVKIHLGVEHDFRPSSKAHPGLFVGDLDGLLARCREKGFDAAEPELIEALAWEASDGKVWAAYNDPRYIVQRHGLPDELAANLAAVVPLIECAVAG